MEQSTLSDSLAYLSQGTQISFRLKGKTVDVTIHSLISDGSAWGLGYLGIDQSTKQEYFVKLGKIRLSRDDNQERSQLPRPLQIERDCKEIRESFEREEFYGRGITSEETRLVRVLATSSVNFSDLELNERLCGKQDSELSVQVYDCFGDLKVPICLQDFVSEPDLKSWLAENDAVSSEWFFKFFAELIDVVGIIHERGHVHNDLHWGNVKVRKTKGLEWIPVVFDYGLSMGRYDTDVLRHAKTEHYFASDLFVNSAVGDIESIGRLMYCVLTRDSDPANYKQATQGRTFIRERLAASAPAWCLDHPLLVDVLARTLTTRLVSKVKSARELGDILEIARVAGSERGQTEAKNVKFPLRRIGQYMKVSDSMPGDLFRRLLLRELEKVEERHRDLGQGYFELYGNRGELIDTLVTLLSGLCPEDSYKTFADFDSWSEENYGPKGRVLGLTEQLIRNGVHITRLFHLSRDRLSNANYVNRVSKVIDEHILIEKLSGTGHGRGEYHCKVVVHYGEFKFGFIPNEWPPRRGAVVSCAGGKARYLIVPVTVYDRTICVNLIVGYQCYYWSDKHVLRREQDVIRDRIDRSEACIDQFLAEEVSDPGYEVIGLEAASALLAFHEEPAEGTKI